MPSFFKCFTVVAIASLTACGGGSGGGSTSEQEPSLEDSNVICVDSETIEINGIEQQMNLLDRNNDGCLSDYEYSVGERVANSILEITSKQLTVEGSNTSSSTSTIKSIKITGSSEISDDKAQLHSNLESGKFHIHIDTYSNASSSESLRIYFDDESASGKAGEEPPSSINLQLINDPVNLTYGVTYSVTCSYSSDFAVTCSSMIVTKTGEISGGDVYYNVEFISYFPLSLTFSEESLPQGGYIIATFCEEGDEETETTCLENYAEAPVSFN
jgi:hypothetical protein